MTEDEMVGWHHRLNGHRFGQTQGGLACCSPWGCRVRHNWATELNCECYTYGFLGRSPFFSQEMKRSPGPEGRFAYNHCERAAWDPGDTSPQTDPSSDFYAVVCNGDQEWRRRENSGLIKQRIWNEAAPCVGVNKDSIWVEIWSNFLNIGCHVNKMS